ncbi:MAG: diaminopimelate decarboxylase [Frankiaceae bacterium]
MSRTARPAGVVPAPDQAPVDAAPQPPADVNAIDPSLWPVSVRRGGDGALTVAELDVRDLAEEHGTPAYVLDEDDFRSRARAFRDAFAPDADVCYAGKAFLCTAVARWVAEEGLGLDVTTAGELAVALRAGFPAGRITMHGNNKSMAEIEAALDAGVGRIVLDSFEEIARAGYAAEQRAMRARALVRVTVGVEAHTHEYIATAHEDQKFGLSLAGGAAAEAVRRIHSLPSLELAGLHSHIGSQIFDTAGFDVAARRLLGLHADVADEHGIDLPELGLGGGFGVAYTPADDPRPPAALAAGIRAAVVDECSRRGIAVPRWSVEPGRAIAGPSAFTLYEVGTVKRVELPGGAVRHYVSVDGGMSDNIRPGLYGAAYSCALASRTSSAPPVLVRVVGKHCENADVVVRDCFLPGDITAGDLVAVPGTGAYCRSMASNYNYLPRPPVVAVRSGRARAVMRRETPDDLLRLDVDA